MNDALNIFINAGTGNNVIGYGFHYTIGEMNSGESGYYQGDFNDHKSVPLLVALDALFKHMAEILPEIKKVLLHIADGGTINQITKLRDKAHYLEVTKTLKHLKPIESFWCNVLDSREKLIENCVVIEYLLLNKHEEEKDMQRADMLAARGVQLGEIGKPIEAFSIELKKLKTPKTKIKPPSLFCDQLAFAYSGTDNTLDSNYVYFTGKGAMSNGKTKVKSDEDVNGRISQYLYFTGKYNQLRFLGRPNPEDRYNVVILKEQFEPLELIKQKQTEVVNKYFNLSQFVVYRLSNIISTPALAAIEEHGQDYLWEDRNHAGHLSLLTQPQKIISTVMNPPMLAFKFKEQFELETDMLKRYIAGGYDNTDDYRLTDVTECFFTNDAKGKLKVVDEFKQNTKLMKLDLNSALKPEPVKTAIAPSVDIPHRNAFSKWLKLNPKIEMLTWSVTPFEFKYAFIITNDEGWMLWHCPYGSRQLLRGARKAK